jgi:hypothetical protein
MRLRHFVLIVAAVTALVSNPSASADANYRAEITGAEDSELASLLDKVSELKTLEDKPPVSEEALRRRADRDLERLADAAHSLGYWDADSRTTSTPRRDREVTVTEFANGRSANFSACLQSCRVKKGSSRPVLARLHDLGRLATWHVMDLGTAPFVRR